ncbi:MAG TPA: hypothetical protein VFA08_11750 [Actinomycetota bacterium]|nr:hypothetical protein [Actinomycetota bacterium]
MRQLWMTATGSVRAIAAVDRGVADRVFGSDDAVALGGWPGATHGRAWASYEAFAEDVQSGAIPDDVTLVMYDPEAWDKTPLHERLHPVRYIEAFCALARANGFSVAVTPHPNLVAVPGSRHVQEPGESREDAYLRSGIVEVCAKNADVYETQAQRLQNEPAVYRAFVLETALLARSVNSNVRVLSGLSTHPGYPANAEMLVAAWSSVRDVVDGHYLSLAKRRLVDVAASFLSRIATTPELERLDATAAG